jgi:choline dehydrogenase
VVQRPPQTREENRARIRFWIPEQVLNPAKEDAVTGNARFDVVLVGAGPAGCVLASRLTEDPGRTVALLEAGPDYGPDPDAWPAELRNATWIWPDSHPWGYLHAGRPADRPLPLPRARVVGGSSAINACAWLRGSAADYDEWGALGNPGWGWADLLPSFRRAEADPLGGPLHGSDGPVPVFRLAEADLSPVDRALVAAAEVLGFPRVADFNGAPAQRPGVGPMPKNVAGGVRMNGAFTYLAPARSRPNLTLIPDTLVDRVCVEDGHAVGVRTADGREVRGREVVLCAGAYGSPAVLLRSGIGPAADLRGLGIPVALDRPGVGAHLLDHPLLGFVNGMTAGAYAYAIKTDRAPAALALFPTLIKARSRRAAAEIDLHVYHACFPDAERGRWALLLLLSLQFATSRGRVRLTSPDPAAMLDIDHGHLADPADLEAACDGIELVARLVAAEPLVALVDPVPGQVPDWRERDGLRAWVREHARTTYHPSSTCRMGPAADPGAVVDHEGRVHGIAGLRVADAAIFPTGPRANLHCTVVAVAEKLADAIRCDDAPHHPLA